MLTETLCLPSFPTGSLRDRTAPGEVPGLLVGVDRGGADDFAAAGRARHRLTELLLAPGRKVDLVARSPRVREELGLLVRLDHQHALTVRMVLPAADGDLAHLLGGPAVEPTGMLAAAQELSAAGIAVVLRLSPFLPGIHERGALRGWIGAARNAGASDVEAGLLELSAWGRRRWLDHLAAWEPGLVGLYQRLYGISGRPRNDLKRALLAPFEDQRRLAGFPRHLPGRG
jgi:DNA repair photolyase